MPFGVVFAPIIFAAVGGGIIAASTDPQLSMPAQLGIAGVFATALGIVGYWMMRQINRLQAQIDERDKKTMEQILPALADSARAQQRQADANEHTAQAINRMLDVTERAISALAVIEDRRRRA